MKKGDLYVDGVKFGQVKSLSVNWSLPAASPLDDFESLAANVRFPRLIRVNPAFIALARRFLSLHCRMKRGEKLPRALRGRKRAFDARRKRK